MSEAKPENPRESIHDRIDHAGSEWKRTKHKLAAATQEVANTTALVDKLETEARKARMALVHAYVGLTAAQREENEARRRVNSVDEDTVYPAHNQQTKHQPPDVLFEAQRNGNQQCASEDLHPYAGAETLKE